MADDLVTQIVKMLKGSPKARADFIQQLQNEKELYNALKDAGFTPSVADPQQRAIERPRGVLSRDPSLQIMGNMKQAQLNISDARKIAFGSDYFKGWLKTY